MKIAIVYVNQEGKVIGRRLKAAFREAFLYNYAGTRNSGRAGTRPAPTITKMFENYSGIVFISACGIAVRLISPLLKSKHTDPAVVCVDTQGRFAVSLVSGHEGGANDLAYRVAAVIEATPVITTGTESHKKITMGIGCRRGIPKAKVRDAIHKVLARAGISLDSVRCAASIDIKKNEQGLISACDELKLPIIFFPAKQISRVEGVCSKSAIVQRCLGIQGVCEPCALLAGRNTELIVPKQILNGVTIACAKENFTLSV